MSLHIIFPSRLRELNRTTLPLPVPSPEEKGGGRAVTSSIKNLGPADPADNTLVLHPAILRSLRLRGDNRFLRPPDLMTPERWLQATVGDYSDGAPSLARSTRAALLDTQHLGAFCQRLLRENASSSYHAEYEAETIVLRGSATPITHLTSQRARRALDSARLQAFPTAELSARWTPTVDVPRSILWADLRRNCFSGHDADVALRLALHALPHPASRRANCAACGSSDGSLTHGYWSCRAVRPLLREVFASCEVLLDLQAWLFDVGLHPDAMKLTSVAKATIYKYYLGLEIEVAWLHCYVIPRRYSCTLSTQDATKTDHLAILKLTEICLKSTTFSPQFASWINEVKPNEILIWSRYVDDIFCIITENSENHILETLNSFNSSIQFTIEKENNGSLPFLDILFTRNRTGFTTKVYRKPTSPTQYLHFASNSLISHKITVVRTLTKRAFIHCSSKIEYNNELKSIENQLLKSGYPLPFIKRNRYKPGTPRNNSNQYISTCYLPYTESKITIARKLKCFGIKTIFRGSPSMASILRNPITKSTDQKQKKDLVYQIPCLNCNSVYIGETSRDLSIRIKEHQRNISKLNPNSLIVDHVRETGHTPDFNNTRILHTNAKTKTQRLILEAIETMKHPKPLNKSIQLPSQYVPLLS
ncbi:hypothetical protein LAZ67_4003865 [Cordylochernes scorpioides]|uniref:Helix-turn-helix domain-containing protein n=1 Tax=Cordylochernes scorpioides TaxID=51811 RepID=A0ABY6KF73_9ARAC|nr:hypothetical protein LAZ67_4003865 [Cordylochernes scorpioides]